MKILASSPYATFSAKEWNSITKINDMANPLSKGVIKKKHFGKYREFQFKEVYSSRSEEPELIQLAFAL
tara:strand:+ start:224 stop:430 length:207 start_codon:yes stop_codon:yes gene_type:complete